MWEKNYFSNLVWKVKSPFFLPPSLGSGRSPDDPRRLKPKGLGHEPERNQVGTGAVERVKQNRLSPQASKLGCGNNAIVLAWLARWRYAIRVLGCAVPGCSSRFFASLATAWGRASTTA